MPTDWSHAEVEATVSDYLAMLVKELAGVPYNKTAHRRQLGALLNDRSEQSIEFKHANISAVLIELSFPYISGYKPRSNYQRLLYEVVANRLRSSPQLLNIAAADADRPIVVPEVDDILSILTNPPAPAAAGGTARDLAVSRPSFFSTNYLEREAQNRSLGDAGEELVLNFERARLIAANRESLADRIEHTARVRGDGAGFDILSFEVSGRERLIEVKTTKYGRETPFYVSRNEVAVSESREPDYHLYRLFTFRAAPKLFTLNGALSITCQLSTSTFLAHVR
jgi:hypothetical protein